MVWTVVKTQAEFDAAVESRQSHISVEAEVTVEVKLPAGFVPILKAIVGAILKLRDSSSAVLRDSSHVKAMAAASIALFGSLVKATATAQVAVHLHDGATCDGGVQIVVTNPQTVSEWCDWYGAEVIGENAKLFKAVDATYKSPRGGCYAPGTQTVAADWDGGEKECGGGLHFSASPIDATEFNSSASKFVACLVPLSEIAVHPNGRSPQKVKARSCWNWYECDRYGKQIGEKYEIPETVTP